MTSPLWRRLNSPKFVLAPMVDHSFLPFRAFSRENGCNLTYTQMINVSNFVRSETYRDKMIDFSIEHYKSKASSTPSNQNPNLSVSPSKLLSFDEISALDSPLVVQFAGHSHESLSLCSKMLMKFDNNIAGIDINLGCPQAIAKRGRYGAHLLQEKEFVLDMIEKVVKNVNVPVSIKIRKFVSIKETVEFCQKAQDCGVQMIALHGRTLHQSKLFTGPADWDVIKAVKNVMSIPVIANGGVASRDDALMLLEYSGADAVMLSESFLENPRMLMDGGDERFQKDYVNFQIETASDLIFRHNQLSLDCNKHSIKGHLFKLLHRMLVVPSNSDIRDKLSLYSNNIDLIEWIHDLKMRYCSVGYNPTTAVQKGLLLSDDRWYMRHRSEDTRSRINSVPRSLRRTELGINDISSVTKSYNDLNDQPSKIDALKQRLLVKYT